MDMLPDEPMDPAEVADTSAMVEALNDALQSVTEKFPQLNGYLLVGWTTVIEWIDAEGRRWLHRNWAKDTPTWVRDGYLFQSLYGDWSTIEEDELEE